MPNRLGRISKMGNKYLRRLLYLGAIAQVSARRRAEPGEDWLWKIMERKKPKQAAIALANRMARTAYALVKNGTEYEAARPVRPKPGHLLQTKGSDRPVSPLWRSSRVTCYAAWAA
jgi:transposase